MHYLIVVKCSEGSELLNGVDVLGKGPADEEGCFYCKNYGDQLLIKYKDNMVIKL